MKELADKPRPSRLRRLSDEEIELWAAVARGVARRRGAHLPKPSKPPAEANPALPPKAAVKETGKPQPAAPKAPPAMQPLDRRLKKNLARGRGGVDGAIDLHGLRQAEAHAALRGFLAGAQARGDKLVIVITGKGAAGFGDDSPGVLRRQVPHWLHAPDLRAIVLGFEEAGRAHGGAGALYVRLRRRERH